VVEVLGDPLERPPPCCQRARRPAGGWQRTGAVRTAPLVGEARREARDPGRVEIVEEPLAQRLGDDEIGLGVEVGEDVAPLRDRPVIDVSPCFEDAQDAVELPGEALAAAAHAALEACHLAFEALG
jgi:hypothetical protein